MKKIIAIGGSNSKQSINQQLAVFAASQLEDSEIEVLDLNDFEMPIYSIDREQADGIPEEAVQFKQRIAESDGVVLSLAEHNGSYSAAYKNIIDWVSRLEGKIWSGKDMFLLATSPGPRGGLGVFENAAMIMPYQGVNIAAKFSLPSFFQNFDVTEGITNDDLKNAFDQQVDQFLNTINISKEKELTIE